MTPIFLTSVLGYGGGVVFTAIFTLRRIFVTPLNFSQASQIWDQLWTYIINHKSRAQCYERPCPSSPKIYMMKPWSSVCWYSMRRWGLWEMTGILTNGICWCSVLSHVWLFWISWTAACQASLSSTISQFVHWVGEAIHISHALLPPSPPALNLSQHQDLFQ